MVPPSQLRSLRLVLHQAVDEIGTRQLALTERVSLGPKPTDTFSVPELSESHTLITSEADGHHLLLSAVLEGTLWRNDQHCDLGSLWRPTGRLPLEEGDQLELRLGETVLSVTFSPDRPEAPPRAGQYRPRLLEPDSGVLVALVSLFATLLGTMAILALTMQPLEHIELAAIPDRFITVPLASTPPAPSEEDGNKPPPELDAVADMQEVGGQDGRLYGEARRNLDQRLRELQEDQPDPGGLDLPSELLALMETELENFEDYVDLSQEEGPRSLSGEIGDLSVEIETGEVGVAVIAAAPIIVPVLEPWLPEPIQQAPRRGTPSVAIRGQIRDYKRQIRSCYERRLRDNPSLSGRLEVEMDILGGRVVMAQITGDTTRDEELGRCIVMRARSWRFPDDTDEKIVLPFVLR